jgi:hypothetical protein
MRGTVKGAESMTTLNKYISYPQSTQPILQANSYEVKLVATVPKGFQHKVLTVTQFRGYSSIQDYINILCQEVDLKEVIIPYEVLKLIDEDYNNIMSGSETV